VSDLSAADVADGRRLDGLATSGPWETRISRTDVLPGRETREIVCPNGNLHPWNVLKVGNQCCWPPTDTDADLIVWTRNHLAALLDAAEAVARVQAVLYAAETETPDDWGLTYVYTSRLREAIKGGEIDSDVQ
jgi:hypothetical protein